MVMIVSLYVWLLLAWRLYAALCMCFRYASADTTICCKLIVTVQVCIMFGSNDKTRIHPSGWSWQCSWDGHFYTGWNRSQQDNCLWFLPYSLDACKMELANFDLYSTVQSSERDRQVWLDCSRYSCLFTTFGSRTNTVFVLITMYCCRAGWFEYECYSRSKALCKLTDYLRASQSRHIILVALC